MEITQHCVVGLTWTLKDTLGEVLDELDSPIEFLVGGDDLLAKMKKLCKATAWATTSICNLNLKKRLAITTRTWYF